MLPEVSVIINCLNGEKYVKEAIDSVYSQTYKEWEIIFWDNASTDLSAQIAQSYDSRLRYFRSAHTVPLGAARNKALSVVRGKYIAFLDCDDVWLPDKLTEQIPLFQDSEVGLVFSDTLHFDNHGQEKRLYARRKFYTGRCFEKVLSDYFLSFETVVVRKEVLSFYEKVFNENFSMIDDFELALKVSYRSKLAIVPKVLAKWRIHSESLTWKMPNEFSNEIEKMFISFRTLFSDFDLLYKDEIKILRQKNAFGKARCLLERGQNREARKALKSIPLTGRTAGLYMLTFFNKKVLNFVSSLLSYSFSPVSSR